MEEGNKVTCPVCGKLASYIPKYKRFYCYQCRKYVPRKKKAAPATPAGRAAPVTLKDAVMEKFSDKRLLVIAALLVPGFVVAAFLIGTLRAPAAPGLIILSGLPVGTEFLGTAEFEKSVQATYKSGDLEMTAVVLNQTRKEFERSLAGREGVSMAKVDGKRIALIKDEILVEYAWYSTEGSAVKLKAEREDDALLVLLSLYIDKHAPALFEVKTGCSYDDDCASDGFCDGGVCEEIVCGECEHAFAHECVRYACCNDDECSLGEFCNVELHVCESVCNATEVFCNGSCMTPACTSDADCDDGDDLTADVCNDPWACNATCSNVLCEIACTADEDCDDGDDATTDDCINPGTCGAFCFLT